MLHFAQSLPLAWQPVLPTLAFPMAPTLIAGRFTVAHSKPALTIAFCAWLAILFGLALIFVLLRAREGRGQMAAAFRTVALACVWQFVALASLASRLLIVALILAPLLAWGILYNFSIVPRSNADSTVSIPSFTDLLANSPRALTSILIGLTIAACLLWLIRYAIAPALKVLADIFRYVGDPEYRARIQAGLERCLQELGLEGKELYLVGHSLGSVIAVDALWCAAGPFASCSSITLVTLGSPLRRFFWRFFRPAIPRPGDLAAHFDRQYGRFRWVNVYRPFDPIGTTLFTQTGYDFSTKQYHRILAWAHTHYWSDRGVLRCVHRALTTPPNISRREPIAREITLFDSVGFQEFSAFAHKSLVALWILLPIAVLCASRLYFNTHFEFVDYTQKVATIEKKAGESSVQVWDRRLETITNAGFPTTYTEDLISYSTPSRKFDFVIDRDLAETLKEAKHGPARARYRVDDPANYYLRGYDHPTWPSAGGWVVRVIFWGIVSVVWALVMIAAGPFLASVALGLYRPPYASLPAAEVPPRKPLLGKPQRRKLLTGVATAAVFVTAAYVMWTRLVVPNPSYQLWRIRSEVSDCLEFNGVCSDPGWIPLLVMLGERDRAIAASREVAIGERVWVLNELKKAGAPPPDKEYEDVLQSAMRFNRHEQDQGLARLAMIARHLSAVGKTVLAEAALREAAERLKKFSHTPFVALQHASDAGLSGLVAPAWVEALKIVVTDVPATSSAATINILLGADVVVAHPRPSSGRASAAIRAQYIFDKIPPAADLAPVLKLVNSWPVTYERIGAIACLAVGLVKASREEEALRLLETIPAHWARAKQTLTGAIPTGDAFRLKMDLKYLFRHFSDQGAAAKLRAIIDRLPDSDVRAAAQQGMAGTRTKAVNEQSGQALVGRTQTLLSAHLYEEVRRLADSSEDEPARWKILAMMIRHLQTRR
jgi:hypothetical protein